MKPTTWLIILPVCLYVSGCSSIGGAAGAVAGVAGSAVTANPAAGYAIGIGVKAATDATVKYVLREWKNDQQHVMANVAGQLPLGKTRQWEIRHVIPYDNERGQIQVVREIDTPLAKCREVLFTVEKKHVPPEPYIASICHQQNQWQWASAEPAVARWHGLQ